MLIRLKVNKFMRKHGFSSQMIVDEIMRDMLLPKPKKSGQDMSRTWMLPPERNPIDEKVIVIDAGGTNFRSCLVSFSSSGEASVSDFRKTSMPATEREYEREEFFSAIADRIEYLRDKSDKIGFCFSYSLDMTREHDAVPNAFSKEIKARSVIGFPVGKSLVSELERRGWKKINKISVVNDTVCALLAGKADGIRADSYIGFILGTGMNAAFIAPKGHLADEEQIIVCESGKCDTFTLSDFDKDADSRTSVPVQFPLEKCCSGAYLGNTVLSILRFAAAEGLFSSSAGEKVLAMTSLDTVCVDNFLHGYADGAKDNGNSLDKCFLKAADRKTAFLLADAAVDRCAHYAASILAANLIACKKGKNPSDPVCIVCDGTTFYKTFRLRERIEKYLYQYATRDRGIYFKTVNIKNAITLGAAVAGLI